VEGQKLGLSLSVPKVVDGTYTLCEAHHRNDISLLRSFFFYPIGVVRICRLGSG
jgi:hypothetical protein